MLTFKRRPQERSQLPPVHVFVGRLAHRVVPAGQYNNLVIQSGTLEFFHHVAREFRQEGQIVLRINDERLPRPAGELIEVCYGTDGEPGLPQRLQSDLRFHPLPDVPRRLSMPHDISDVSGSVIERRDPNTRIMRSRNERITRTQARTYDAKLAVALLL